MPSVSVRYADGSHAEIEPRGDGSGRVLIGSSDQCQIRLQGEGVLPVHAYLAGRSNHYGLLLAPGASVLCIRLNIRSQDMAKANANVKEINWLAEPEEHNYPAAESYLRLLFNEGRVAELVSKLRSASSATFKAKDIFRASRLSLLGVSNLHVDKDRKKIRKGMALSPLLLVRDEQSGRVVIADGYHRLCAIYEFDEDAWIHCKIV